MIGHNLTFSLSFITALFNVILFTVLSASKSRRLRTLSSRRDYFLLSMMVGCLILAPFLFVLAFLWRNSLNRNAGFSTPSLIIFFMDVIAILILSGLYVYVRIYPSENG